MPLGIYNVWPIPVNAATSKKNGRNAFFAVDLSKVFIGF
jgi:hypothetical protein